VLIFRTRSKVLRPYRLFSDAALDDAEVCAPKILKSLLDSQIFGAGRHLFVDLSSDLCTDFYFEC
jgi:hypothetical protein